MPITGPFTATQVKQAFKLRRLRHLRETSLLGALVDANRMAPWTGRNVGGKMFEAVHEQAAKARQFMFPPSPRLMSFPAQGPHVRSTDIIQTNKVFQRVPGAKPSAPMTPLRSMIYPQASRLQTVYGQNQVRLQNAAHKVFDPKTQEFVKAPFPTNHKYVTHGRAGLRARMARFIRVPAIGGMKPRKPK